jgi:hypothetical protein
MRCDERIIKLNFILAIVFYTKFILMTAAPEKTMLLIIMAK